MDSVDVQAAVAAYASPVAYGDDDFGQAMKLAGQLIHADLGVRVLTVSQGSYDTHANQAVTLDGLLTAFSDGIDKFMQDAVTGGFAHRVTVLVWTEFGRRVAENASGGTDHGSSAPMFLIGTGVRGGLHGGYPSLTDLDNGNLRMTTDFRGVLCQRPAGLARLRRRPSLVAPGPDCRSLPETSAPHARSPSARSTGSGPGGLGL